VVTPPAGGPAVVASTPTSQPVGGHDVVYVETGEPTGSIPEVLWALDGRLAGTGSDFALDAPRGSHTLTATTGGTTLSWTVDATGPTTTAELPPGTVYHGSFTMSLKSSDGMPEFRVDGDGWHKFYGWPTDPDAPYLFTPRGTDIDGLAYGNLGEGGLTVSPFAERKPGYGRHRIEYRSIDAAGNVGPTRSVTVTLLP
jgi:hypothetical protein